MSLFKYIILAIVQGLTEPIPISSSGHMKLIEMLFNGGAMSDFNYEIICNFGSFIAILIIFWKDIVRLVTGFFTYIFNKEKRKDTKKEFIYCWYLVISTVPVAISGFFLKDYLDTKLDTPLFLGICFLVTSIALFLVRKLNGKKSDFDITLKDAIIIGLVGAITVIPGISRSGSVLVGCLLCGINRESSLKYTFILYFPVSIGAMILGVPDILAASNLTSLLLPYTIGMLIAGVITYFSYEWLSTWVKKGKLGYFAIYCFILAIFVLIYFR